MSLWCLQLIANRPNSRAVPHPRRVGPRRLRHGLPRRRYHADREVALKILHPQPLADLTFCVRFRQERTRRSCGTPIVLAHEVGERGRLSSP
jgi:hypothetical protein